MQKIDKNYQPKGKKTGRERETKRKRERERKWAELCRKKKAKNDVYHANGNCQRQRSTWQKSN